MVSIEDIDTLKKSKQKIYIITFKNHQDAYKFQKESFTIRNADDNVVEVVIKHEINELISCLNNYELMNFDIAHQSLEEILCNFMEKSTCSIKLFKLEWKSNYKILVIFCLILTMYTTIMLAMYDPKLGTALETFC